MSNRGWRHCNSCHHEFAGTDDSRCDWWLTEEARECGGSSYQLQAYPPLLGKLTKAAKEIQARMEADKRLN